MNNMGNNGQGQAPDPIYMPEGYQPAPQQPPKTTSTMAIVSLVLGILSIVCCCVCYGFNIILAIIAIILAVVSKRETNGKMGGMAIAGLVLGIIGILCGIIIIIILLPFLLSGDFQRIIEEGGTDYQKIYEDIYNSFQGQF